LVDEGEGEADGQDGLAVATYRARQEMELLERLDVLHLD
jgi:hypothetical protein